jgi:hypothetical protein
MSKWTTWGFNQEEVPQPTEGNQGLEEVNPINTKIKETMQAINYKQSVSN